MSASPLPDPAAATSVRANFVYAALIVAATLLAYANSFSVPFVFDDIAAVTQNPSLSHFRTAFHPSPGLTVTGRPVVNLSLWLNHAISGEAVWSYHAFNLALHLVNALLLFAFVRRTLGMLNVQSSTLNRDAIAFSTALLWSVHPLQTASVTYVMERSELLGSFFILLCLYAFVRAVGSRPGTVPAPADSSAALRPATTPWLALAVLACLCGMAAKEMAVTIPVLVLCYDRTFISRSLFAAVRARPRFYLALAATWLLLVAVVLRTEHRGASTGLTTGLKWTDYALTQIYAVVHYLRLTLWPSPLIFDYDGGLVRDATRVGRAAVVLLLFVGASLVAWRRKLAAGFAGVAFFIVLAPSSSVVPVATRTIGEHRIYLALAVPLVLAVCALYRVLPRLAWLVVLPAALLLGGATFARNVTYGSVVRIWSDTVAKYPNNARAHYNLAVALLAPGEARDPARAAAELANTLELDSAHAAAPGQLGATLVELGRFADALPQLAEAVRLNPDDATAHSSYGRALSELGRSNEALVQFDEAIRLNPADASARTEVLRLRELSKSPAPR